MILSATIEVVLAAVAIDLAIGDPRWLPHPVRAIGALVAAGEERWHAGRSDRDLRRGAGLALAVVALAALATAAVLAAASAVHPLVGFAVAAVVGASALALRGLGDAALAVAAALERGDLAEARRLLPALCGRDPEPLDARGLARAAVESVAENASDAVVAPLFYLVVAGPVGAIAYKAVNTLDSMIGHRDERHLWFGRFAARLDDVANWIPARLTALALALAAGCLERRGRCAAIVAWRDAGKHASPNAGWPEAAMAGALGIRLGGPVTYAGDLEERAWLGGGSRTIDAATIRASVRILRLGSVIALALLLVGRTLAWGLA